MKRIKVAPAIVRDSELSFYYPPTLQDDYAQFLNTDIPYATYTFELIPDWYKKSEPDYESTFVRA